MYSFKTRILMHSLPTYKVIDEWPRLHELNTTGTREKFVAIGPDEKLYYFKTSLYKVTDNRIKDYPSEFWSEIAASQLGELLALPVLRYDIASHDNILGCISQNMATENESITEGVRVIAKIDPTFISDENYKKCHNLTRIHKGLAYLGINKFKRIAIEMLLFDCIIGNTDRHSENWAIIRNERFEKSANKLLLHNASIHEFISLIFNKKERDNWQKLRKERKAFYKYLKDEFSMTIKEFHDLLKENVYRFAPFYDNGSSLGRELTEERIKEMIKTGSSAFDKYFHGGYPDIRVCDKKITFNDTIIYLLRNYPEECSHFIQKHLSRYSKDEFSSIIENIDNALPPTGFEKFRLTKDRKNFYVKLVDYRINHLLNNIPQS